MKKYLVTVLLFGAFAAQPVIGWAQTNRWGTVTNGLQMSISLKEGTIGHPGNPRVIVLFRVRNISANQTFTFYCANAAELSPFLSFQVISPSGGDISPKSRGPFHGSGLFYKLTPEMQVQFEAELSFLCKFARRGSYKVTANWDIESPTTQKVTKVVSNPLVIIVGKHGITQAD